MRRRARLRERTDSTMPASRPKRRRRLRGGGQYAELSELFCTADQCPVIVGNTLVFRDDNHVTTEYAQVLAPVLTEKVERALSLH